MKQEDMVRALAELDGFKYVKVIGEPGEWHWQLSKAHDKSGTLSRGAPRAVSYIVRDKPDDGDEVVALNLVPSYLASYDAIIPLIQRRDERTRLIISRNCNWQATPAQLCEALLRATGRWQE